MNDVNMFDQHFLRELEVRQIKASLVHPSPLLPSQLLTLANPDDWGEAGKLALDFNWRWVAGWAEDRGECIVVSVCLEQGGNYLSLRTKLDSQCLRLPSHAPYFFAANRPERHIQDLFGIEFIGHPDSRRWIRHQAWDESAAPLRKAYPVQGFPAAQTPPDNGYPFLKAQGQGVYEIPVGPVHAGIIEPGHFRFQAVGENVLHLEERLGYVHKGVEKIAEGRTAQSLARLAGRVSGDTTVGHSYAACLAMERAVGMEIPPRAAYVRGILAERERVINHLWDMAAICNDVAFTFAYYQLGRLRELWLRDNQAWFGHRLMMDSIVPGGVSVDLNN